MEIELEWLPSISLKNVSAKSNNLIYNCELKKIPEDAGIYMFGRKHGKCVFPLYVGQAQNLRKRIKQELNSLKLMKGIQDSLNGNRILLIAKLCPNRGQQEKKLLDIAEKACIEHALSEGNELLNVRGTKTPIHTIISSGKKRHRGPFPKKMNRKAK